MKTIPKDREGKIFIFGNSMISKINFNYDLFLNASSFQEMEPDVVENYLKYVNKQANCAFLFEATKGKEIVKKVGQSGVLKPTTLEDYQQGLHNFNMLDISDDIFPYLDSSGNSSFTFWQKKK